MKILYISKGITGKETVTFEYAGEVYIMHENELEAAYRCQERRYRLQDAMRHLNELVYGVDENDGQMVSEDNEAEDDRENRLMFEAAYGVTYVEASASVALSAYVDRFESGFDCSVDEDTQWENAIKRVLLEASNGEV